MATDGNFKIEIEEGDVLKVLNQLTDDYYIKTKVLLTALKKGGEVLKKETEQVMKSKLGDTATKKTTYKNPKKNKNHPMIDGVRVIVDKDYHDVLVSILKEYRLKWFETGTDERYTKGKITGQAMITKGNGTRLRNVRDNNKLYRGSIKGYYFFRQARNEVTGIDDAVNASLNDSFNKLFKD